MSVELKNKETITLNKNGKEVTVDLYSEDGKELVSELWSKLYAQYKLTHDVTWMGIPIIQFPEDIMMMHELIWKLKPDVIVECGIAHGGSLVFYSSLFELIGHGRVVGVDVEIREHNRVALSKHPMRHRIDLIEGSSIDSDTVSQVKEKIGEAQTVLILLDSNHSYEHVKKEIELYKDFVTSGSYLVVMDGAQAYMGDIPDGKSEWDHDNPLRAIEEFTENNSEFEIDPNYTRLKVTSNPKGFLKKIG